jgi:hypothetical protein
MSLESRPERAPLRDAAMAFDQRLRAGLSESETRPARSPPDLPPQQRELRRGPQFGQVHAEPFPQAGLARLGHGDDVADLPAGDPAPLEQAFVVLPAIIGAVDRRVRGQPAPGRPASGM